MLGRAKSIFTTIGGCASKPKVLEGGLKTEETPEKVAEEPEKVAIVAGEGETRDVVITSSAVADISGSEEINKTEDKAALADDENVGVKIRSLGNLFLENEEEKESNKSEAVTKESTSSEKKPIDQAETLPKAENQQLVPAPGLKVKNTPKPEEKLPEEVKLVMKEAENVVTSEKKSEEVKADLVAAKKETTEKSEEILKPVEDDKYAKKVEDVKQAILAAENVEKPANEKKPEEAIKSAKNEDNAARSATTSEEVKEVIVVAENVVQTVAKTSEEVKPGVEAGIAEKKIEHKTETPKEKKEEAN